MGDAVGAIADLFGEGPSSKAADAAEGAADTQAKSADKAIQFQKDMYEQNRRDLAPWTTAGTGAVNMLSVLMGISKPDVVSQNTYKTALDEWEKNNQTRENFDADAYREKYGSGLKKKIRNNDDNLYRHWQKYGDTEDFDFTYKDATTMPTLEDYQYPIAGEGDTSGDLGYGSLLKKFTLDDFNNNVDPGYEFRKKEGLNAIKAAGSAMGYLGSGNLGTALEKYGQGLASEEYQNAYSRFNSDNNTIYNRLAGISGTGQTGVSTGVTSGSNTANSISNLLTQQGDNVASGLINSANASGSGFINMANAGSNIASKIPWDKVWNGVSSWFGGGSGGGGGGGGYGYNSWGQIDSFAEGGRPEMGEPSVVGEEGEEMFVPDVPGEVVPNENTITNPPNKREMMIVGAIKKRIGVLKRIDDILMGQKSVDPRVISQRNNILAQIRMLKGELDKGERTNAIRYMGGR